MNARDPRLLSMVALLILAPVLPGPLSAQGRTRSGRKPIAREDRYVFQCDQSHIVQTGGFAGVHWTYALQGQFCLIVDPNTGSARFEQVDASAVDVAEPARTLDPNGVFNLSELTATLRDEAIILFGGQTDDNSDVVLALIFQDDTVSLTGQTVPPPNSADFFIFSIDATATRKYGGGTGEPDTPYQIATAEHMNAIGTDPNDWDKHFQLTADIDLSAYQGTDFNIIGPDPNTPFRGTFDGAGHTISSFRYEVQGADHVGLFGIVADPHARIENLTLVSPSIEVSWGMRTGSLVAHLREGTLLNCHVRNAAVQAIWFVGGLAGETGYLEPDPGTLRTSAAIINCSCEGSIQGSFTMIGGLIGRDYSSAIHHCFATGGVIGEYETGGLIGSATYSRIVGCYSQCAVTGIHGVGGLVGRSFAEDIIQCYAAGPVAGDSDVGGLLWDIFGDSTTVLASFWDIEASGQTTSCGGEGKTTTEMQRPETFREVGWDFVGPEDGPSDTWAFPENGGYPILWWQLPQLPEPSFAGGAGSESDPYLIATAAQLNSIGYNPRLMAAHFRMVDDIDLEGMDIHLIGRHDYPYAGVFDGGGFRISNFTHTAEAFGPIGLFRLIDSQQREAGVRNVGLIAPDIDGEAMYYVGSLVGQLGEATLRNCYVEGGRIAGIANVGGLVGQNGAWDARRGARSGRIISCHANATVTGRDFVGGLVGTNARNGTMIDCDTSGATEGMQGVGGLVGANSSSAIFNCHSRGTVSAQWYAGGLVGSNQEGLVESCFASAVVTGEFSLGGLVGNNRGTVRDCYARGSVSGDQTVGGLVGRNGSQNTWDEHPGTIDRSYAGAIVTGTTFTGGLVGYHEFGTVTNCLWDIDASGQNTSAAGRGLTTVEMQTASAFLEAGWDFVGETENGTTDLWWIIEGQDYPRLWWETDTGN